MTRKDALRYVVQQEIYDAIKEWRNVPERGNGTGVGILTARETVLHDQLCAMVNKVIDIAMREGEEQP